MSDYPLKIERRHFKTAFGFAARMLFARGHHRANQFNAFLQDYDWRITTETVSWGYARILPAPNDVPAPSYLVPADSAHGNAFPITLHGRLPWTA